MTTTVYLIRHGETDWNVEHRWQGHTDIPLNSRGQRQAEMVAQHVNNLGVSFAAIYSSDLARAYQTAWEIGAAVGVAVQLLPALREIDLGTWSGLTREEIRARYPVEYQLLEQGQDIPRGGAETGSALFHRTTETFEAMVTQYPNSAIIFVTHGGVIRAITNYVRTVSQQPHLPHAYIGNTSVSIVRCVGDKRELVTYNAMQHLAGLDDELSIVSAHPDDTELPEA